MESRLTRPLLIIGAALLLTGCGQKEEPSDKSGTKPEATFDAVEYLPQEVASYEVTPRGDVRVIRAEDLAARLTDSVAAVLEPFGPLGVVQAGYTVKSTPVRLRIVQFAEPEPAYGLFSQQRPSAARLGSIGAESYFDSTRLCIYSDTYVFTIEVDSADDRSLQAATLLGQEIHVKLPRKGLPPFFMFFPSRGRLSGSNIYYLDNYLGVPELNQVYTTKYSLAGDTAVFFLSEDLSGEKYLILQTYAATKDSVRAAPEIIPYDRDHAFVFDHPHHGPIVAGLVRGKLVGVVGFEGEAFLTLTTLWVKGLQ